MFPQKPVILYVDDEQFNLDAFVAAYRPYYTIYTALSGNDAIKILAKHEVELIISDQRMPEMTGVQFLEAVIPEYSKSVRMILTGFSDIEAIIKAVNNGLVLRYITKPWDENELKQIIDIGIKIYRQEQSNMALRKNLQEIIEQQEHAVNLFQKYVPKDIVDQFVNTQSDNSLLKAEHRIVSVVFADIHQFIQISESLESKDLVNYLNKYLTVMVEIIIKNHGYIHKILGDGLMAVFGAPTSTLNNQHNARVCAQEILEGLKRFNETEGKAFNFETTIGISIVTGEAIVGHTIAKHYLSYSIIGEVVNRAVTVEQLTRGMYNTILTDEATYQLIKDESKLELLNESEMNGKVMKVYKLI